MGAPLGGDQRYVVGETLGQGATAQVFSARDRVLEREIVVKLLEDRDAESAREEFLNEARIHAGLVHPNIIPVYDLEVDGEGASFFTMARVSGIPLDRLLAQSEDDDPHPHLGGINERVTLMLKICDALSWAHARGIIHCDVKPGNILVGQFGEAFLLDWGAARSSDASRHDRAMGTPLYMSPEQARGEAATMGSDIYAVGATLWHLLMLRPPFWRDTAEAFWEGKRAGALDAATAGERLAVPRHLLAILTKALAAEASQRYATITALGADLRAFQAGLAVSAYRESSLERLVRTVRRHRSAVMIAMVIAGLVGVGISAWWYERSKSIAHWGALRAVPAGSETWVVQPGRFTVEDGAFVSRAPNDSIAVVDRWLEGPTAIEFTGSFRPGALPGDLSVVWFENDPRPALRAGRHPDGPLWYLQVGAQDNRKICIQRKAPGELHPLFAEHDLALDPTRSYRIRAEIDGRSLRLFIDGRLQAAWTDAFAIKPGWCGIYGFFPGKVFNDLRIASKGPPAQVPALAMGDACFDAGALRDAARHFQRIALNHAGSPMAEEARFKWGLALRRSGLPAEAPAVWTALRDPFWSGLATLELADAAITEGDDQRALALARPLAGNSAVRNRLGMWWMRHLPNRRGRPPAVSDQWIAFHDEHLRDLRATEPGIVELLIVRGRDEEAVERFPDCRATISAALRCGRLEWLAAHRDPSMRSFGLMASGRYRDLLADPQSSPSERWRAAWRLGESQQQAPPPDTLSAEGMASVRLHAGEDLAVLSDANTPVRARVIALQRQRRFSEALALWQAQRGAGEQELRFHLIIPALSATGRLADTMPQITDGDARRLAATTLLVEALIAGNQPQEQAMMRDLAGRTSPADVAHLAFAEHLIVPLVRRLRGATDQMTPPYLEQLGTRYRWHWAQRLHLAAGYLSGRLDEAAFAAAVPDRREVPSLSLIVRAIRLHLDNHHAAADRLWQDWLALPVHQRVIEDELPDTALDTFARWRAAQVR
jgi:tRNA A-37 threonylcarbamoyl transferase component Bud32